jgi:hypothetical protein
MSRVGRLPVKLPAGVEVKIDEHLVEVKGPKGKLTREIHPEMQIAQEDNILYIDDGYLFPEYISETTLGKPPDQWHLSTLKSSSCASAGTGFLALLASTGSLP